MKAFSRFLTMTLSAVALAATAGLAQAGSWFSLDLFGGKTDKQQVASSSPAPAAVAPSQTASRAGAFRDGRFTGPAYDAYYGIVQVQANVQGGRLISVNVLQYPTHRRTSRAINRQALPMLEREVIQAQSVRVYLISGATLTSEAYLRSLYGALTQSAS